MDGGIVMATLVEKKITFADISLVDDNPFQPRKSYDEKYISGLAASFKEEAQAQGQDDAGYGVKQAPPARIVDGRYQLAAGHCRKRGVLKAEGTIFPLVVEDLSDADMRRIAMIENMQRQDMSHSDTAAGIMDYLKSVEWMKGGDEGSNERAVKKTAKDLGKPCSEIRDYIAFSKLDGMLQGMVDAKQLSFKLVSDLAKLDWRTRQKAVRMLTKEGKTAAEAEVFIKAAIKEMERQEQLEALGMVGDQGALFDVPVTTPETRQAQAKYAADMQTIATILAKYGDAEGDALTAAIPLLNLDIERERLRIIIASAKRMDNALMAAQSQRDIATIMGK